MVGGRDELFNRASLLRQACEPHTILEKNDVVAIDRERSDRSWIGGDCRIDREQRGDRSGPVDIDGLDQVDYAVVTIVSAPVDELPVRGDGPQISLPQQLPRGRVSCLRESEHSVFRRRIDELIIERDRQCVR